MVFEFAQVGVKTVGDGGLDQAAEALDGIEFRAIGRGSKRRLAGMR
jgi:hypothetical protein